MSDDDDACWYILDTRQVVGNCALWWGPDGNGYTCEIDKAGLYTRASAFSGRRSTDVPVHRDVVKAHSVTHVRVEGLWRDEETGARLRAEADARDEAEARRDELSEGELAEALEINPFGEDDDWTVTVLSDEIVTAAKVHACHDCGTGKIRKGLRHRKRAEKTEGGLLSFRWCHACIKLHIGYPYGEQREGMR